MEQKVSILVVDDNISLCKIMSFVLGRKGYAVNTAGDGPEAIEKVKERPFDMIFMDFEKEMYSEALPDCVRLLKPGGTLICDNVAFRSSGDFNDRLAAHPGLDTSFIFGTFHNHSPDEDAISVSVKKLGQG